MGQERRHTDEETTSVVRDNLEHIREIDER